MLWTPVQMPAPIEIHTVDGQEVAEYTYQSKTPHKSVFIRRAYSLQHYLGVIEVQKKAWLSSSSLTDVMSMTNINNRSPGGLVLVMTLLKNAHRAEHVVGFAYSWATTAENQEPCETYIFSDLVGVLPSEQGNGFATMLKAEQRRRYHQWWDSPQFVGTRGAKRLMKWTVLPVLTMNHHLNFDCLGASCGTFYPNIYGEIEGGLYGGLPSDRILMTWDLDNPRTLQLQDEDAPTSLLDWSEQGPVSTRVWSSVKTTEQRAFSAAFPSNFQSLKLANFGTAKAWQTEICDCIERMLEAGFYIAGFKRGTEFGKFIFMPREE